MYDAGVAVASVARVTNKPSMVDTNNKMEKNLPFFLRHVRRTGTYTYIDKAPLLRSVVRTTLTTANAPCGVVHEMTGARMEAVYPGWRNLGHTKG